MESDAVSVYRIGHCAYVGLNGDPVDRAGRSWAVRELVSRGAALAEARRAVRRADEGAHTCAQTPRGLVEILIPEAGRLLPG